MGFADRPSQHHRLPLGQGVILPPSREIRHRGRVRRRMGVGAGRLLGAGLLGAGLLGAGRLLDPEKVVLEVDQLLQQIDLIEV